MTAALNTPAANFKPMSDKHGKDTTPSFIKRALKTAVQPLQRAKTKRQIAYEIGKLPERKRNGYAQQVDVIYAIGLILMQTGNLATGYAFISLTELGNLTGTKTANGLGRVYRGLKQLRAMGKIEYSRPLLNPQDGGRDRIHIRIKPSLFDLHGTRASAAAEQMKKALTAETLKQKKLAEYGKGLPLSTLDALANPTTAATLLAWWQWYGYTKAAFRRFFINVRRAGLAILPPPDTPV